MRQCGFWHRGSQRMTATACYCEGMRGVSDRAPNSRAHRPGPSVALPELSVRPFPLKWPRLARFSSRQLCCCSSYSISVPTTTCGSTRRSSVQLRHSCPLVSQRLTSRALQAACHAQSCMACAGAGSAKSSMACIRRHAHAASLRRMPLTSRHTTRAAASRRLPQPSRAEGCGVRRHPAGP